MASTSSKTNKKRPSKSRRLKTPSYKSFKLNKRIKHPGGSIKSSFKIFAAALALLRANWKLFAGILLVYVVLQLVFVRGFSGGTDLVSVRNELSEAFQDGGGQIASAVTLFGVLLGSSSGSANPAAGAYQSVILIIMTLASIWAVRQTHSHAKNISLRNVFYKSTHPLIPFLLVLAVISLQLIPMAIGGAIFTAVVSGGLAINATEFFIWGLVFFLSALLSIYMISSSLFALYIVTLPNMTPMKALRSARGLVRHRRWTVVRKVLFLPLVLLVLLALIMLPMLIWLTVIAEFVFFALGLVALIVVHTYMYLLYRELL